MDGFLEYPDFSQNALMGRGGQEKYQSSAYSWKDYQNELLKNVQKDIPGQVEYSTVIIGKDNADRNLDTPVILGNFSPGAYQAWLEETIRLTRERQSISQRFVFIQGWDEDEGEHPGNQPFVSLSISWKPHEMLSRAGTCGVTPENGSLYVQKNIANTVLRACRQPILLIWSGWHGDKFLPFPRNCWYGFPDL